ncbi:NAD(P)H-dependent flavin oxidoreductase [Nitrincola alkalilacustris]|uniref:NAD(P)H-dependent flavin oxidoreductase n=1 Tax=Nitrincola alkalilacustris TaxID=1571224 RepID=UPI00124C8FEA|nr:nitronate monooxygenase [Nitrincola alkalilacustris]
MAAVQRMLNLAFPIIQAPMAGVQDSALAIAVSNAGGLGSLPCAMLSSEALHIELSKLRSATDKPFNVNFFCHRSPVPDPAADAQWRELLLPYYQELGQDADAIPSGPGRLPFSDEAADTLAAFRPAVVSFHFGLPSADLLARVRSWGSRIFSSATTLEEALWLEEQGVDAVIAQGVEAGGHRGMFLNDDLTTQVGTFALLPQLKQALRVPVIAAGGIATPEGVRAALALGADAVQVGTAYLLCHEATTSAVHRQALKSVQARHTAITNLFTGRPARGIVNRIMQELGPINQLAPAFPLATSAIAPLRAKAESRNSGDFSPLWAGQNTQGCREVSAAEITRWLAGD